MRDDEESDKCPKCDKCGAPIETGMMAVICPHREKCEFWPDEQAGVDFVRWMRGEIEKP